MRRFPRRRSEKIHLILIAIYGNTVSYSAHFLEIKNLFTLTHRPREGTVTTSGTVSVLENLNKAATRAADDQVKCITSHKPVKMSIGEDISQYSGGRYVHFYF